MSALPETASPDLSHIRTWIFDLDNTLYPASSLLFEEIRQRIQRFVADHYEVDLEEARRINVGLFRRHGTTLCGLIAERKLDPAAFLSFVHAVPLEGLLPSPRLVAALDRLPGRKLIHTNASAAHAARICAHLGIADRFAAIWDIAAANYVPKPREEAYRALLAAQEVDPTTAAMFEDIAPNLRPAKALGMTTVWVRPDHEAARLPQFAPKPGDADFETDDLVAFLEGVTVRNVAPLPESLEAHLPTSDGKTRNREWLE